MGRTFVDSQINTAAQRSKLAPGKEYGVRIAPGSEQFLMLRVGKRGSVWFTRWRNGGAGAAYKQAPIGRCNDTDTPRKDVFTFQEALARAAKAHADLEAGIQPVAPAKAGENPITVADALTTYCAVHDERQSAIQGRTVESDTTVRLRKHVLGSKLAAVELRKLTEKDLRDWLAGLPDSLKGTTVERIARSLKAGLNHAFGDKDKRVRNGLKFDHNDNATSQCKILEKNQISALIAASYKIDDDFGLIMHVLAATGTRFSQAARILVSDLHGNMLNVPRSRKGKSNDKNGHVNIQIDSVLAGRLRKAAAGRGDNEPLLQRWQMKRSTVKAGEWQRDVRVGWKESAEFTDHWKSALAAIGNPAGITPYSLRHSNIVRWILAGRPIVQIANLHDTSVKMIEKHYAFWINKIAQQEVFTL